MYEEALFFLCTSGGFSIGEGRSSYYAPQEGLYLGEACFILCPSGGFCIGEGRASCRTRQERLVKSLSSDDPHTGVLRTNDAINSRTTGGHK